MSSPETRPSPPLVADTLICVDAPAQAASSADGQMRGTGLDGFYEFDRRLVHRLVVEVGGREPAPILGELLGPSGARFVAVHRGPADVVTGPAVTVERVRELNPMVERMSIRNAGRDTVRVPVEVCLGSDLSDVSEVRSGQPRPGLAARARPGGLAWRAADGLTASVTAKPPPEHTDPVEGRLGWRVELEPGQAWELDLRLAVDNPAPGAALVLARESPVPPWSRPQVHCDDSRLGALLDQSLADLEALLLADPLEPTDAFLAAGPPWFLTLFGRDCLWAARMLLPLGTNLAAGTLRVLARRQGARPDPDSEEEPGKIIHEMRRSATKPYAGLALPPSYYGTVDATPLFVCLLADAWRWGLPDERVEELLPAAEQALGWLRDNADPDGDGFVEYIRTGDGGLVNQGWKDSADAIQFADGRPARPPIALSEVQGYAYEAARSGAALLDAFGRPGAAQWRDYAARLRQRFRDRFWVEDTRGPYVAIALDADKRPVDGLASNMGHLPGTGILDPAEIAQVAARLGSPDMSSGFGLRTLSAGSPRFNPLSYHGGTVWPHDTAVAVAGLAHAGHHEAAAQLLGGIVDAAHAFDYRLPELWGGEQRSPGRSPLPYPAACRPQAWSAAAAVSLLGSLLGLRVDVPAGRLTLAPMTPPPLGAVEASGLRVAGQPLSVRVGGDGRVQVGEAPPGLTVHIG